MAAQLSICISAGERPLDTTSSCVSWPLPSRDLGSESRLLCRTARQAFALQDSDLDLRHVQPSRVRGRVVKLDPAQQCRCGFHPRHLIETLAQMRVEIVHDQVSLACMGISAAQHPAGKAHEIDLGAPSSDLRYTPLSARLDSDEDVTRTGALVFVVYLCGCSGPRGQRVTSLAEQLFALLVQGNHWLSHIVGARVQIQQVVHTPAVLCSDLADAPHQPPPGFEESFFNIRRIVYRLIVFTFGWRRAASVSSSTAQRCAPGGGPEQARALTCTSTSASYVFGLPDRASSCRAKSSPRFRYAARVRQMAVLPHIEHLHDLWLRHLAIQGSRNVRPIKFPRHMQTFGTKIIHDPAVPLVQTQFGLSAPQALTLDRPLKRLQLRADHSILDSRNCNRVSIAIDTTR